MTVLQSWIVIGVPALIVMGALFTGRSGFRALVGYVVLAATLVFFVTVPADTISAAFIAMLGFVLVATGRGTEGDDVPEHHQGRKRFTTDPSAG